MNAIHVATFRANVGAAAGQVDSSQGRITRATLIEPGEARNHGMWIDATTISALKFLLSDRRLKAYVTHNRFFQDASLEEIGYWEKPAIANGKLVADFTALESWKNHKRPAYDTLFELAQKLPEEFGVSLVFECQLAWALSSGSDLPARRRIASDGFSYDPSRPSDALQTMPSARPVKLLSGDFVDMPAATSSLFRSSPDGLRVPSIAELRTELSAITGADAASARRRGQIATELRQLRSSAAVEEEKAKLKHLRRAETGLRRFGWC